MPVPRTTAALDTLTVLLTQGHRDLPADLVDYRGHQLHEPDGWLWHQGSPQPGLQNPDAYVLDDALAASPRLHEAPGPVLDEDGGNDQFTAAQQEFCRRSLDVTMKGGTTSAVIYPLALCELARHFRFRNLGGASAGAIAASLAAAAELGRARAPSGRNRSDQLGPAQVAQGRLRQGFAGMADIVAWVTQSDQPAGPEQFRLVQLFKPTPDGTPLFRVIAAAMRQQFVRGALLLLVSLPARALWLTLLPFVLAPLGLSAAAPWRWGGPWWSPGNYLWSALLLWLAFGWLVPLAALAITARAPAPAASGGFAEPLPAAPPPAPPRDWLGTVIVPLALAAGWVAAAVYAMGGVGLLITIVFLVAEVALVLIGFGFGVALISSDAKQHRFGLIGGSGAADGDGSWRDRVARLFDRTAQVLPRRTVGPNLTDWLTQALADLAGLPGDDVLRFGHMWTGGDFVPGDPEGAGRRAADDPRLRSINLELMSTELIRRAPYRFPLPVAAPGDELYFDPSDLDGLLPRRVIEAMTLGAQARQVRCLATGELLALYPFPQPWDLPVVFATRASLALPALFQAVRLYELRQGSVPVRTEFGERIAAPDGTDLRFPLTQADAEPVAQELWLTDGGVTSNFPIHMFDSPLPLWPTVGIDLAPHPVGAAHQDVYLMGDARAAKQLASPLRATMSGFISAIIGTGLQWRDNAQLQMPAFQARIAVVRQRSNEGGNNLFMTRSDIASLALRGVVAGMRLRRRFASDPQWQRQQWLRLRVAGQNVVDVAERLQTSLREQTYARLVPEQLSGTEWSDLEALRTSLTGHADPNPPGFPNRPGGPSPQAVALDDPDPSLDWYLPSSRTDVALDEHGRPVGFFANLTTLVSSSRYLNADPAVLRDGVPRPLAELRQVPRS
ncbi:MAG: hypothetical protein IPL41_15505 [Micropruina sp.]|nr:hypothetical protein [Micropruina sp.]